MNKITLELTDEQLAKVKEMLKEEKPEWPQYNDKYWTINEFEFNALGKSLFRNDLVDKNRREIGRMFRTEQEAIDHYEWLKARATIIRRIKEENGDWEPDWSDSKRNFCIFFSHFNNTLDYDECNFWQEQEKQFHIKSKKIAEKLIVELENEYKIYFGVK